SRPARAGAGRRPHGTKHGPALIGREWRAPGVRRAAGEGVVGPRRDGGGGAVTGRQDTIGRPGEWAVGGKRKGPWQAPGARGRVVSGAAVSRPGGGPGRERRPR